MTDFKEIKGQYILYSFLNWGKGHLSRSIDVCRRLSNQGNRLLIACKREDFLILNQYIENIEHINFPNYPFSFSGNGDFTNDLLKSKKAITDFIKWEQKNIEEIRLNHQISIIISDHRYGFYSKSIPSFFITHQVQLALKWWQFPAQIIHKKWMKKFSYIWIMDDDKNSLAGKLSKIGNLKNAQYIGHFSRFEKKNIEKTINLGVCNGPEPYNRLLLDQLVQKKELDFIISSVTHSDNRVIHPKNWKEIDELFYKAKTIHGYCGYSTLMDLIFLSCKGVLEPTKGQTEQIYLHTNRQLK